MHHGSIPQAITRADIWSIQYGLHLRHREIIDQWQIGFLRGDRQHLAALLQAGRYAILHEFHEGFDRR
jgi:hypothetical protein